MSEWMIRAEDVAYRYPFAEAPALEGVSFRLRRGGALPVTRAGGRRATHPPRPPPRPSPSPAPAPPAPSGR